MKNANAGKSKSPWCWVPSLYFAEGVPYMIVTTVSILIFKQLNMDVKTIAFFTSFLMFPWAVKPLWAPIVDMLGSKKQWVVACQIVMAGCFALCAFAMPFTFAAQILLAVFMLLAFISATHDIAADGFYMVGLQANQQAFFTGVRGTAYRIAMITAQGGVVLLAGLVQQFTGVAPVEFSLKAAPNSVQISSYQPLAVEADGIKVVAADNMVVSAGVLEAAGKAERAKKVSEFKTLVNQYNAEPSAELLSKLDAPDGIAMLQIYFEAELEKDKSRQLSVSGEKGDLALLNGDYLNFTAENQHLPQVVMVEAGNNTAAVSEVNFKVHSGNFRLAWLSSLLVVAVLYALLGVYHLFFMPKVEKNAAAKTGETVNFYREFGEAFASFFRKKGIVPALIFILLYRFAESQLLKVGTTFMIDSPQAGGLALSNSAYGTIYGVLGVLSLLIGGLAGGWVLSRHGLRFWMLPMAVALNIPDAVYVALAYFKPESLYPVMGGVVLEQFGYGFGFAMYMLFMVYFAEDSGKFKTSHFAIMTGLQAVGLMIPGMFSGNVYELLDKNYYYFFWWVMLATVVSFGVTIFAMRLVPASFGRKEKA